MIAIAFCICLRMESFIAHPLAVARKSRSPDRQTNTVRTSFSSGAIGISVAHLRAGRCRAGNAAKSAKTLAMQASGQGRRPSRQRHDFQVIATLGCA